MKTLSIPVLLVCAYLSPLGQYHRERLHTILLEENFEEMSRITVKTCVIRTFALILVV